MGRRPRRGAGMTGWRHDGAGGPDRAPRPLHATHLRVVLAAWLVVAVALGFFAARVETALSGAGWETGVTRGCASPSPHSSPRAPS